MKTRLDRVVTDEDTFRHGGDRRNGDTLCSHSSAVMKRTTARSFSFSLISGRFIHHFLLFWTSVYFINIVSLPLFHPVPLSLVLKWPPPHPFCLSVCLSLSLSLSLWLSVSVSLSLRARYVWVCVCVRERETETERQTERQKRERESRSINNTISDGVEKVMRRRSAYGRIVNLGCSRRRRESATGVLDQKNHTHTQKKTVLQCRFLRLGNSPECIFIWVA